MTRRHTLPVLLAAVLSVASCQRVQPPSVALSSVTLGSIGLRGATLITDLALTNPNDFAIDLDSIAFDLEAREPDNPNQWVPVASGTQRESVRIEGGRSAVIEIPSQLTFSSLRTPVRSVIEMGSFNYRITGGVRIHEPRRKTSSFSQTGNIAVLGNR